LPSLSILLQLSLPLLCGLPCSILLRSVCQCLSDALWFWSVFLVSSLHSTPYCLNVSEIPCVEEFFYSGLLDRTLGLRSGNKTSGHGVQGWVMGAAKINYAWARASSHFSAGGEAFGVSCW